MYLKLFCARKYTRALNMYNMFQNNIKMYEYKKIL
jgi:hypothetical protein